MKTRLSRSSALPAGAGPRPADFSTGMDSPVMAACETNKSLAVSTRQSAGIMSPADSQTRSPGTSSLMATSMRRASAPAACAGRSTVAVLLTMALSASAAWLDLRSCQKRSSVDSTTMVLISRAPLVSCVRKEMPASSVSSRLNGLRKLCHRCSHQGRGFSCSTSLGPTRSRTASAWVLVRPAALLPN